MEEVPDEEPQVWGGVLGEGVGALLQLNEEYVGTLKQGQVDTPVPKIPQKRVKWRNPQTPNIKNNVFYEIKSE